MTTYKRIKVWDGTNWQLVGAQIPQVLEAYGTEAVTLDSGAATETFTFPEGTFSAVPLVFTQLTGSNAATISVAATEDDFTATISGSGSDEITFNWFAVQPE